MDGRNRKNPKTWMPATLRTACRLASKRCAMLYLAMPCAGASLRLPSTSRHPQARALHRLSLEDELCDRTHCHCSTTAKLLSFSQYLSYTICCVKIPPTDHLPPAALAAVGSLALARTDGIGDRRGSQDRIGTAGPLPDDALYTISYHQPALDSLPIGAR